MHCLIVRSHCALKRASKLHTHLCALLEFKILATVSVYVCFDSAENSSNMNIRFFVEYKKKTTVFLEAYHRRMGRYSNVNQRSRAATENFVFLKAANNGSLKTNCSFESRARWNALAKKFACPKPGKRLLPSLAFWTNWPFLCYRLLISSDEFNVSDVRKSSGIKTGRIKLQGETYKKHNPIKKETDYS